MQVVNSSFAEITAPTLEKCPGNVQVTTSSVLTEVQRPAVLFRTGEGSYVRSTCSYFGQRDIHNFTLGLHDILCKAFDPTFGEEAVSVCRFSIRVKREYFFCLSVCLCMYVCMYLFMYVFMYLCMCVRVCMYVCACVDACVCIITGYVFMCVWI